MKIALSGNVKIRTRNTQGKCKGKVHFRTGHEGPEEEKRYSLTLSLTSVLFGVGSQRHALAALPPKETQCPMYRRGGGGASEPVWAGAKDFAPTGIRHPRHLKVKFVF